MKAKIGGLFLKCIMLFIFYISTNSPGLFSVFQLIYAVLQSWLSHSFPGSPVLNSFPRSLGLCPRALTMISISVTFIFQSSFFLFCFVFLFSFLFLRGIVSVPCQDSDIYSAFLLSFKFTRVVCWNGDVQQLTSSFILGTYDNICSFDEDSEYSRGAVANVQGCDIVVSESELQSYFRTNTVGKGMNSVITPVMG